MNLQAQDIIKRNAKIESALSQAYRDISKRFTTVKGKRFAKVLQAEISELRRAIRSNIEEGVKAHWSMANEKSDQMIDGYLQNIKVSEQLSKTFRALNLDALNTFLTRTEKGMNLSKQVWTLTSEAQAQIENFLASGITVGKPAVLISKDLNRFMNGKGVQYKGTLLKARNITWQAFRLAATEMNMAYRLSEQTKMQKLPFITGCTIHLSGAHPRQDICDELEGEYPKDFIWAQWHPVCICYRTWDKLPTKDFVQFMKTGQIAKSRFVTKLPPQMNAFMKTNAEKLGGYVKRGTEPYWIKDNFNEKFKLVKNELTPAKIQIPPVDNISKKNIANMVNSIDINEGGLGQGWNDIYGCSNNLVSDVLDMESEQIPRALLPSKVKAIPSFVRHHYIDTKGRYRWLQMYEVPEGTVISMEKRKAMLEKFRIRLGIPAKEAIQAIEKAELQQKALEMSKDHIAWQLNISKNVLKENYIIYKERTIRRGKNILLNYADWNKDRINILLREAKNKGIENLLVKGKSKWYWKE